MTNSDRRTIVGTARSISAAHRPEVVDQAPLSERRTINKNSEISKSKRIIVSLKFRQTVLCDRWLANSSVRLAGLDFWSSTNRVRRSVYFPQFWALFKTIQCQTEEAAEVPIVQPNGAGRFHLRIQPAIRIIQLTANSAENCVNCLLNLFDLI